MHYKRLTFDNARLKLVAVALAKATLAATIIPATFVACAPAPASTSDASAEEPAWVGLHPDEYRDAILRSRHRSDPILSLYREDAAREEVLTFFTAIVHSKDLAAVILENAAEYDVSPSLAVALSWEESRFDPRAVNRNKASIDRGLFQLNSKSFPKLTEKDFFNPVLNARYGVAHLRWCLDLGGSEVAGLAMYNAGTNRVRADSTPKATLDYVSRVLAFRDGLNDLFDKELAIRWQVAENGDVLPAVNRRLGEGRVTPSRFPILNASR
jgi:soluble lytic murein transglycosylase-like protein